jgi:hypothetical protein
MQAFDTWGNPVGKLDAIKAAGYEAILMYGFSHSDFKTLLTKPIADAIHGAGLKVGTIFESGDPTSGKYFTPEEGTADGQVANRVALEAGQPSESPIILCVDYNAQLVTFPTIVTYFEAARPFVKASGYSLGCYGEWTLIELLMEKGLISHGFLSLSRGFPGWEEGSTQAAIVQMNTTIICGLDADTDNVRDVTAVW